MRVVLGNRRAPSIQKRGYFQLTLIAFKHHHRVIRV
jgi:hypothetical protein